MGKLEELIVSLPDIKKFQDYNVYPQSLNQFNNSWVFMIKEKEADFLVASGEVSKEFKGDNFINEKCNYLIAPLTHENAQVLRRIFPFTAPVPVLKSERTFGVGDRLGLACPGHIRVFKEYDARPVFAQQSIRELNLTNRTYADVLDAVSFSVFREGYKYGFGADGDHLKKPEEIVYALENGYTMITLDCSEHIRNDVLGMSKDEVDKEAILNLELKERYLNRTFTVEDEEVNYTEEELKRCILIYQDAIRFAAKIYHEFIVNSNREVNFEISIDETFSPTTPTQHYFVANELLLAGVKPDTLAPRFCGEFQKGIDYIGDIDQFEKELKTHAAIARHFGYRLSVHSGSDKFSIFELIGKYTKGRFHVKTAGTNWLEAMEVVAMKDQALYREIHAYALEKFPEAQKYYYVTTDLNQITELGELSDSNLPSLFKNNHARQLIHITYGFILNAKNEDGSYRFKDRLYGLWRKHEETYSEMLHKHIGEHLKLLYQGFDK